MGTYHITAADGGVYEVEAASDQAAAELEGFINARIKAGDPQLMGASAPGNTQVIRPEATQGAKIAPPRNAIQDSAAKPDIKSVIMQGLTAGLSDEAVGVGGMAANALIAPFSRKVDFDPSGAYKRTRDAERARIEATRKESPWLSFGGELGGSLLTGGGAAANVGKGLGSLIKQGAKVGAASGAVAGFGYGEGAENSLVGAGLGAGLGGLLGAAIPAAGRAVGDTYRGVRNFVKENGTGRELVSRALQQDQLTPRMAAKAIADAQNRGVPLMMADLGDNLRGLAGATARKPGTARTLARSAAIERQQGQGERVRSAITRDLGPIVNPYEASDQLIARARAAAAPLYDEAYKAPLAANPELSAILNTPFAKQALGKARTIAANERRNPDALGFVLNDGGDVTVPGLDRFVEVRGPKPASPMSVISGQGNSAPADLVTFVRRNGGLRDSGKISKGGELKFMGANNAGRKGVPFAGQDAKFGPLVNEFGSSYDEMAEKAWEAGYFGPPSTTPRPTEREFLEALDGSYRGNNRVFSIYDEDTVNEYANLERNMHDWNAAEGIVADRSTPAGPAPFAPAEAYGKMEPIAPTWQTLDYVKRGMDDVLEQNRNPMTGKMDLTTAQRAENDVRAAFLNHLDTLNPAYAQARKAYQGPAREKQALEQGRKALAASDQEIVRMTENLSDSELDQFLLGYRAAMGETVERRADGGNKAAALLGTPRKRQALDQAFAGKADLATFGRTMDDEQAAYDTYAAINTGSQTAGRLADDAAIEDVTLLQDATGRAIKGAANGGLSGILAEGMNFLGDARKFGAGKAGERARENAAALLFNPDPDALNVAMREALRLQAADRLRVGQADRGARYIGGLFGRGAGGVSAYGSRPVE